MQKRKQSRFKYHYFSFYYFQFKQNVVWVVAGFVCFYFFHIYMVISVNYLQIWQCVLLTSVILPVTVYMYIFTLSLYFLFLSMFSLLQSYSHRLTFRCAHTHTFKVTADIVFTTICNGNFWYSNETCGNLRLLHFFQVVGGMTWCITTCNFDIDVDLLFQENSTIGQKMCVMLLMTTF